MSGAPGHEALVRALFDAYASDDVSVLRRAAHTDLEIVPVLHSVEGVVYRGPDGVEQWWRQTREVWDRFDIHVDEVREAGAHVLVLARVDTHAAASGIEMTVDGAYLIELRDNLIRRLQTFLDRAEAVAAFSAARQR